jgi:hypothetical protein
VFLHLSGHSSLGIIPDQVVAVIESINAPNIGTPLGTERTKAYIVGLRLPSGNFTVAIYLHLVETNRACIYAADPLEVTLDGYSMLEGEAIQFAESMGFMLDNLNFRAKPPDEIARLVQVLPFFHETPPRTQTFDIGEVAALTQGRRIPGEDAAAPRTPAPSGVAARAVPPLAPEESAALARLLSSF